MAKKIEEILIENVKGISNKTFNFTDLYANKLNILVASNGFGKTSLSTCFDSLRPRSLSLEDKNFHNGLSTLSPKLKIRVSFDNSIISYEATSSKNELHNIFEVSVIKSRLFSKTRQAPRNSNIRASSQISHEEIILVENVPASISLNYNKNMRTAALFQGRIVVLGLVRPGNLKKLKAKPLNSEARKVYFCSLN